MGPVNSKYSLEKMNDLIGHLETALDDEVL
ncbi:MAG: hypothetical protein K0S07_1355, partial [Chlamydiales bacterium]|nr:hypothetical protein [Chlamydiales bacterium]